MRELDWGWGNESGSTKLKIRLGLFSHMSALLRRPGLLLEAIRSGWTMRRHGRPYLSEAYLGWRVKTAYGMTNVDMTTSDLVHYLEWRQQMRRIRQWGQA